MRNKPPTLKPERPWLEIGFVVVLLAAGTWLAVAIAERPGVITFDSEKAAEAAAKGDLTPAQTEALDVVRELEKLLLSLTSLLIGGVVAVVAKDGLVRPLPPRPARLVLIATFAAAAFSMYFGYFFHVRLLEILEYGYFSAQAEQLWEPLKWQYRLFLVAVVGLATFVVLAWFDDRPEPTSQLPVKEARR